MFDLLTNILIWIIAIPIFIILFRAIPKDWFRIFGLVIFAALVAIIFANFRFVEDPVPKVVVEFLTFPFTLVGILLLLLTANYWLRLRNISIRSGDKVDNKGAVERVSTVRREIIIALLIFAIATNNATSEIFTCYLEQQGENAIEQSYRRPVNNLTGQDLQELQRGVYDLIVVLADNPPYEPRLQEAVRIWNDSAPNQKPYIILSGGKKITYPINKGYPCLIADELPPNRDRNDIKNEIIGNIDNVGLFFDPRFATYFLDNTTSIELLSTVDLTEADLMCQQIMKLSNTGQIRASLIIEPSGFSVRSSGDEINRLIKSLETNKLLSTDSINNQRIVLITSPIEATRAFLSFRNQNFNTALTIASYPSDSHSDLAKQCPWPVGKQFTVKPKYFLFNAESFVKSERVWTEVKELIFYTLRFWLRPPITDAFPYFP